MRHIARRYFREIDSEKKIKIELYDIVEIEFLLRNFTFRLLILTYVRTEMEFSEMRLRINKVIGDISPDVLSQKYARIYAWHLVQVSLLPTAVIFKAIDQKAR